MAPTTRALTVNPAGAIPFRFQLYPSDLNALDELLDKLNKQGPTTSAAKVMRLALRELLKRPAEEIEQLLDQP